MTATAEDVAEELRRVEPARNVTLKIAAGMAVEGDPNLLRSVKSTKMEKLAHSDRRSSGRRVKVTG